MQKSVSFLLLLMLIVLVFVACGHKNRVVIGSKSWPYVPFASAHLYTFNQNFTPQSASRPDEQIVVHGQINPNATDKGSLNPADVQTVCGTISQTNAYVQEGLSSCFIPRHGMVFFDSKGAIVANLAICFECEAIKAQPMVQYSKKNAANGVANKAQITKATKDIATIKQIVQQYTPVKD